MPNACDSVGCLILTDERHRLKASALEAAMGLPGACTSWAGGPGGYDAAQFAFQDRCGHSAVKAVAAFGEACLPALALGIQLPVDRLALLFPRPDVSPDRRLLRFVRRNLALCGADTLCVGGKEGNPLSRAARWMPHGDHLWLDARGAEESAPWTKCEFSVKNAICGFLRMGVHSKLLAENPEMCIIYR